MTITQADAHPAQPDDHPPDDDLGYADRVDDVPRALVGTGGNGPTVRAVRPAKRQWVLLLLQRPRFTVTDSLNC